MANLYQCDNCKTNFTDDEGIVEIRIPNKKKGWKDTKHLCVRCWEEIEAVSMGEHYPKPARTT